MASSLANNDQITADEQYARQLQQQELANNGLRISAPLLRQNNDEVHQNMAQDLNDARRTSPRVMKLYAFLWIAEIAASTTILAYNWEESCDEPLKYWLLFFSLRIPIVAPIQTYIYLRRREDLHVDSRYTQYLQAIQIATFTWFIVGQTWAYSSEECAPYLYYYSVALIVSVYVSLALPLLLLVSFCICLPCVIVFLRFVGDSQAGAPEEAIEKLPTHKYQQGDNKSADLKSKDLENKDDEVNGEQKEDPLCAICRENFASGEEIRTLPCKHEFHSECVDHWLKVKKLCPLCRADITKPSSIV